MRVQSCTPAAIRKETTAVEEEETETHPRAAGKTDHHPEAAGNMDPKTEKEEIPVTEAKDTDPETKERTKAEMVAETAAKGEMAARKDLVQGDIQNRY